MTCINASKYSDDRHNVLLPELITSISILYMIFVSRRMKYYVEATKKHNLSEAFGTFARLLREKEPKYYDEICYKTDKVKSLVYIF